MALGRMDAPERDLCPAERATDPPRLSSCVNYLHNITILILDIIILDSNDNKG